MVREATDYYARELRGGNAKAALRGTVGCRPATFPKGTGRWATMLAGMRGARATLVLAGNDVAWEELVTIALGKYLAGFSGT